MSVHCAVHWDCYSGMLHNAQLYLIIASNGCRSIQHTHKGSIFVVVVDAENCKIIHPTKHVTILANGGRRLRIEWVLCVRDIN